jgi:hypothetical protein
VIPVRVDSGKERNRQSTGSRKKAEVRRRIGKNEK